MRVLALMSGGKDSCYTMMKCVEHGHEVVGIANLHPLSAAVMEMDSFMYQTVGSELVPVLADALGLPLFRAPIRGVALDQRLHYACADGDEVEDLHQLLVRARAEVPFDGVCSGAILSNYQRTRVEDVCSRLGLDSLAFLWQREQGPLLSEMASSGVEAVLVKVASLGLGAAQLGRSIRELEPLFRQLHDRFGFHQCGEGGEYETFTLDCPLFSRPLQLLDPRPVVHSEDASGMAPVVLLAAAGARLVDRPAGATVGGVVGGAWWAAERLAAEAEAAALELDRALFEEAKAGKELEAEEAELEAELARRLAGSAHSEEGQNVPEEARESTAEPSSDLGRGLAGDWLGRGADVQGTIEGWTVCETCSECRLVFVPAAAATVSIAGAAAAVPAVGGEAAAVAQLTAALLTLPAALASAGLDPSHLLYVRLYTSDMRHYKAINGAYGRLMERAPAARACVQIPLGSCGGRGDECVEASARAAAAGGEAASQAQVGLEVLASRSPKRYLHVSSISEWAPRMIGPYCQMTSAGGVAHVAGNLGLIPHSMVLAEGGVAPQTRLALANSAAVLRGLGHDSRNCIGLVVYVTREEDLSLVHRICRAWLRRQAVAPAGAPLPPLLVLQVGGLPMGAAVEAQLEAAASQTGTLLLAEWVEVHQSVLLRCSAAVVAAADQAAAHGSGDEGGEGTLHRVMLQCLVNAAHAADLDLAHLARAVREARASLLARLSQALGSGRLCGSSFTRCFCMIQMGFDLGVVERALLQGSCAGGESGTPAVLALPVERIGHGGAQLALQVHLGIVTTRRRS